MTATAATLLGRPFAALASTLDRAPLTMTPSDAAPEPFRIAIPGAVMDDLRARLDRTRLPDAIEGAGWDHGTDMNTLRSLVQRWRTGYDWRRHEHELNTLTQFRVTVDGVGLHYVHVRARSTPSASPALPIVLLHGWPGSFYQMSKLVPRLVDPAAHGGDAREAFDVVVPSLPGFGFSDHPTQRGMTVGRIAPLVDALMTRVLGYRRYGAAGGDIGAGVVLQLAQQFPAHVVGVQTNGGNPYIYQVPPDLSPAERAFVQKSQQWMQAEGAYAMLQSTKPQTPAAALNDSPAGLAAWLVEKYRAWSDCAGADGTRDVSRRFTPDELLTFVTLYWVTQTIGSSMRIYYEGAHDQSAWAPAKAAVGAEGPPPPAALAVWPGDIAVPPREWAERQGKLARYTVMPRGGHFAEWEEPQLVAGELRTFFRPLRANG